MSKFTLDLPNITQAIDWALEEWARALVDEIVQLTPRDRERPPKNINRKDWKTPNRKWGVVSRWWNFYTAVTGALKKSIDKQKKSDTHYVVWVIGKWASLWRWANPSEYWKYLEYGTVRMKPRSFIRLAFLKNREKIERLMQNVFRSLLK